MKNVNTITDKQNKLYEHLRNLDRVAVAFSAGVDSTYLLAAAREALGGDVIAITGRAVSVPDRELAEAHAICERLGVEHVVVDVDQLAIPGFKENPPERCYLCKKALFTAFTEAAAQRGFDVLAEGSNADDMNDYRPGMKALAELNIKSPLLDAGLTKDDIRSLSRKLDLPTWDKPAYACLATRIPCGEEITIDKLDMIEKAEEAIQDLKFRQLRVRHHGELARVEIDRGEMDRMLNTDMMAEVSRRLKAIGFRYVTLDLGGYQRGSTNKK